MFVSEAFAQSTDAASAVAAANQTAAELAGTAAPAAAGGGILMTMAPLFLVFVIFYFFLVRPQQKRLTEYQKLVASLRRGDRIVTSGGIIGTIHRIETQNPDVMVEVAEGVVLKIQRTAIAEVLAKTGAVNDDAKKSA